MRTVTTVEATGADLTEVLANAAEKLDAYYGGPDWVILEVNARPHLEQVGQRLPVLWIASVGAEGAQDPG